MKPNLRRRFNELNRLLATKADALHRDLVDCWLSEVAFRYGSSARKYPSLSSPEDLAKDLAHFTVEPADAGSVGEIFLLSQAKALVSKYPYPLRGLDTLAETGAWNKFIAAEQSCKVVNESLSARATEAELHHLRGFVSYVLRDFSLEEVYSGVAFGPGTAIGIQGQDTASYRKVLSKWSVSPGAIDYARAFAHAHPQVLEVLVDPKDYAADERVFYEAFSNRVEVVDHNNVLFVPKTTLTRRSIAVEPLLNNWIQTGVDHAMRERLRAIGNDLRDQSRNQQMAWEGSFDAEDGFCTIDLSSASDSISTALVEAILPSEWFHHLNRWRSRNFKYNGVIHRYEKFCSMGNSFCFPLQTTIFLAACSAVGAGTVGIDFRVYGDDIIVRKKFFEPVVDLLGRLGFQVNKSKTFSSGFFRESCGGDYWQGVDVRPAELKNRLDNVQSIFSFHNALLRSDMCGMHTQGLRQILFAAVPEDFRFVAPNWAVTSDGAFRREYTDPSFLSSPHVRRKPEVWGWEWKELSARPVNRPGWYNRSRREAEAALLYAGLSGSSSDGYNYLRRKTHTKLQLVAGG